jgi:transcription-repair coupling factor (superfamily II helicase)
MLILIRKDLNFYQRLYEVKDFETIDQIRDELEDRFGKLPEEVENLLYVSKIKFFG